MSSQQTGSEPNQLIAGPFQPKTGPAYKGLYRTTRIPSCVLDRAELRRLYGELDKSSLEAAEREFATFSRPASLSQEEFERLKANELARCGVNVHVHGAHGQHVAGQSLDVLDDVNLPEVITRVRFESSFGFQLLYNREPLNRFDLILDFSEAPSFNAYNPWDQPTPNESALSVMGPDETWVTGVHGRVISFIGHRKSYRGGLHSPLTFSLANYLIGLPAALWLVYRIDGLWGPMSQLPVVLRGATQVYFFLIAAFAFRAILWLIRWAFPQIELKGSKTWRARALISALAGGLLVSLIYDVLKAVTS
ncbi:MAG TPA: hypothetical protein VFT29_12455 [Gemmatimonadaceae bacterium]|nr:hypothetical protein [Gemmatimonadaceae bacterium]